MPVQIYKIFENVLGRRKLAKLIYKDTKLVSIINNAIADNDLKKKKMKEMSIQMGIKLTGTKGVSN